MTDELKNLSVDDIGKELDGVCVTAVKLIFERNGFVIFACKGGFSVKGNYAGDIVVGLKYMISGTVTSYRDQMQISAVTIGLVEDDDSELAVIAEFLKDNFEDIGSKLGERLAEAYGNEVLDVLLNNPEKAAQEITGLTVEKACDLSREIEADCDYYKVLLELRKLGLSNKKAVKVFNELGSDCVGRIRSNPYSLMNVTGIGFDTCEVIGKKLQTEPLSINRFEAAVVSVVSSLHEETKDTYLEPFEVRRSAHALLSQATGGDIPAELYDGLYHDALIKARDDKYIVIYRFKDDKCASCDEFDEGARISSRMCFVTEYAVKRHIEEYIDAKCVIPDRNKTLKKIRVLGEKRGITLDPKQEDALYLSLYSPIAIITGGPGTGKTTITSILAEYFKQKKIECRFCAPTGRAAKRLSEAAGVNAGTIHRLLEMSSPSDDEDGEEEAFFGRNRNNPLECRVVVADEASMIDVFLFKALLDAMRPGSSLILIGDPDQLPSVGAGNVLADLISCPLIPCVRLQYIFRQDEESSIASNAVRILRGEYPVPGDDFEIIKTGTDDEAVPFIESISVANKGRDFAILSPTRRYTLGTENLNTVLQMKNNDDTKEAVNIRADLKLYPGDLVMQIRNNYSIEYFDPAESEIQRGVFNGEMGSFYGYDVLTGKYDVLFDGDRKVGYEKKTMSDIELAYSVTVHKAQGCEFDSVVVVLGKMGYKLSNKKLLYTAVTRGKNKVTIIDSGGRLQKMLSSEDSSERKTSLSDFLSVIASRHNNESDQGSI